MEMTLEIARALSAWATRHFSIDVKIKNQKVVVWFMPTDGRAVQDYLASRCSGEDFLLLDDGLAVVAGATTKILAEAKALLGRQSAAPPVEAESDLFDDLVNHLETVNKVAPEATAPLQIPADGVAWDLCDGPAAKSRLVSEGKSTAERKETLKYLSDQPQRRLPRVSQANIDAVQGLGASYPNFQPAIVAIVQHLRLLRLAQAALHLPPLLLAGPPGVGKTQFARALAAVLPMHLRMQSMADATAGWLLTGSSRKWADATPGLVARTVAICPDGKAPLILLDELDKAGSNRYCPPDTSLLGVLETSTARVFRDENLDMELDVSPVSYLLTANRLHPVRPEILSRLKVIEIQPPTAEQMPAIVKSVDAAIRADNPHLAVAFDPLDDAAIGMFAALPPRDLRRLLLESYARAVEREPGRTQGLQLEPRDIAAAQGRSLASAAPVEKPPYVIPILVDPRSRRIH